MALTFDDKTNFAYSVVATAPSPATTGTTLEVAASDGAKFPDPPFNAVVWPTGVQPSTSNAEIVRVTGKTGDQFTIVREQEGTTARSIILNDQIAVNITVKTLTDIQSAFTTASVLAMPIGGVCMWFTDTAPTGYLFLRGQAVSRTTYSALFSLWGTTFGSGDGSTTFNLPDMQQYIPIGKHTSGTVSALGAKTGSFDHTHGPGTLTVASHTHGPGTLTVASHTHDSGSLQVASHTHGPGTLRVESHSHDSGTLGTDSGGSHTHTGSTSTDGDHSHSVNQTGAQFDNDGGGSFDIAITDAGSTDTAGSHNHSFTTDSDGDHSHGVSGNTGSNNPLVTSGTTASSAPAVSSGVTGATAPAVSAGVTAGTSPAVSSGVTASANPPVIAVNFIVRATNEA